MNDFKHEWKNRVSCHSSPHLLRPLPWSVHWQAVENTAFSFPVFSSHSPELASHRFLGTANIVWTPAKTGDVFWVTLCQHIYTICLWHLQVDIMIHYTYSILNIATWKILSSGEPLGMGQCAEGADNKNLFLEFYSFSRNILVLVKMFLRVFHKMDMVRRGWEWRWRKEGDKIYTTMTS